MIYDGKISKLSHHPFKDGYYVGEILTDGGRGCVFEMNKRRANDLTGKAKKTHTTWCVGFPCWVEIDDETFKVLDWGI